MNYLFIDTSTSNLTLSLLNDYKEIYRYSELIENDMASKILSILDLILKKNNMILDDIDKIFVVNGPGSFTGIRVGVTISKVICWALKKEIIPISSLEVLATTPINTKFSIPMIDARRGNVFAGIYDKDLNIISKDQLINLDEILKDKDSDYTIVSYNDIQNSMKPSINPIRIIMKHKNDKSLNPHHLNPNYLKLTEAEESQK